MPSTPTKVSQPANTSQLSQCTRGCLTRVARLQQPEREQGQHLDAEDAHERLAESRVGHRGYQEEVIARLLVSRWVTAARNLACRTGGSPPAAAAGVRWFLGVGRMSMLSETGQPAAPVTALARYNEMTEWSRVALTMPVDSAFRAFSVPSAYRELGVSCSRTERAADLSPQPVLTVTGR